MWILIPLAMADDTFVIEGEVQAGEPDHVFVPFEVPAGTAEIEVQLDDGDPATILDWGLDDPDGHRGWGGGNTEPAVVGVDAASRSYEAGPIPPGTWRVVIGKAKLAGAVAPYTITVTLRDEATLPVDPDRRPYVPAEAIGSGARWVQGDLHVHSLHSGDAPAELDEIADLARSEGLDFVVLTEHNVVSGSDFLVAAQARHPDVLLVPGIEVTTYDGHVGAIGATSWVDHRLGQPDDDGVVDVQDLADQVTGQGAVLSIHHPTLDLGQLCIGCAWTVSVPEGVSGVEIGNGSWFPTGNLFTPTAIDFWDGLCADGHRLAALGGSDDHRAGRDLGSFDTPVGTSRTAVWVEELTVEGVLEGIRAQRTQVLLDGSVSPVLDLRAEGTLDPEGTYIAEVPRVSVALPAGDGELHWFVDGDDEGEGSVADGVSTLTVDADQTTRVRAEWWADDHPTTVTSHVWLRAGIPPVQDSGQPSAEVPPDTEEGGCGCALSGSPGWSRWFPQRRSR